jgi:hypothetical protein
MENLIPRDQIPESWLEKSRCPYCSSAPLWIEHPTGEPDYFVCPNCEMSFRIAQNHPSVFVVDDPVGITTGYKGSWVEMKTLLQTTGGGQTNPKPVETPVVIEQPKIEPAMKSQPVAAGKQDLIYEKYTADVINIAAELYALGNSKEKIKAILVSRSHLSDDESDEIVTYVSQKSSGKNVRSLKLPRWAMGCAIVPFLCLLVYGLIFLIQYRSASGINVNAEPKVISIFEYEKLPQFLQDLIPQEVQEVKMPQTIVTKLEASGGEVQACPKTGAEAVALFGGESFDWQYKSGQNAWMLQSSYARTLSVPEQYLGIIPNLNKGLFIQFVPGPAKIGNAYMLLIRCP